MNNQVLNLKNTIFKFLFIGYGFLTIVFMWSEYQNIYNILPPIFNAFQVVMIVSLILMYFLGNFQSRSMYLYIILMIIGAIFWWKLRDARYICFIAFYYASAEIDYEEILRSDVKYKILAFLIVIVSFYIGILPDHIVFRNSSVVRHSLGFVHPNLLMGVYMTIILEFIFLKKKRFSIVWVIISIIGALYFGQLTNGRASEAITILACIGIFVFNNSKKKVVDGLIRKLRLVFLSLPVLLTLVTYLLVTKVSIESQLYEFIQKISSNRLDIFQYYYNLLGIHWLPQKPDNIYIFLGKTQITNIDNSYWYLCIFGGLLSLVGYLIIVENLINKALDNSILLGIIILYVLLGMVDASVIYPFIGFFTIIHVENKKVVKRGSIEYAEKDL